MTTILLWTLPVLCAAYQVAIAVEVATVSGALPWRPVVLLIMLAALVEQWREDRRRRGSGVVDRWYVDAVAALWVGSALGVGGQ
ncbi:MAG: hypothetical protein HC927_07950 [Deltaproteobacteria bacterium]|nr:hypothetical protein [Deltaproteobacteria bacterium]